MAGVHVTQPPRVPGQTTEQLAWAEQVARVLNSLVGSGTTANRPTEFLYPGRPFYDTSLGSAGKGMMIWRNSDNTAWVNATGASV